MHTFYEAALAASGMQRQEADAQVQATLLNQLSLQVRVVALAAERGYPLQAFGAVATAYEIAVAVGYIGTDVARARQWLGHQERKESYPPARERRAAVGALLLAGGVVVELLKRDTEAWEQRYTMWCMAKHANPRILRVYGIERDADRVRLSHGPLGGGKYTRMSQLAVFRASQLLLMATSVFFVARKGLLTPASLKGLNRRFACVATQLVDAARVVNASKAAV